MWCYWKNMTRRWSDPRQHMTLLWVRNSKFWLSTVILSNILGLTENVYDIKLSQVCYQALSASSKARTTHLPSTSQTCRKWNGLNLLAQTTFVLLEHSSSNLCSKTIAAKDGQAYNISSLLGKNFRLFIILKREWNSQKSVHIFVFRLALLQQWFDLATDNWLTYVSKYIIFWWDIYILCGEKFG